MIIKSAATKFDVRTNSIVKAESDTENNLAEVTYESATVPFLLDKLSNVDVNIKDRYLYVNTQHEASTEKDKFHWISMCYILANDEIKTNANNETYGTVIDKLTIEVRKDKKYKIELENVPVKRNYRTNILIDDRWWATRELTIQLDRAYDGDFNGTEDNGKYNEAEPNNN